MKLALHISYQARNFLLAVALALAVRLVNLISMRKVVRKLGLYLRYRIRRLILALDDEFPIRVLLPHWDLATQVVLALEVRFHRVEFGADGWGHVFRTFIYINR